MECKTIFQGKYKELSISVKRTNFNSPFLINPDQSYLDGYVSVYKGHPFYNKCLEIVRTIDCHNGITFAGNLDESDEYYIGFNYFRADGSIGKNDKDFVIRECIYIAEQLFFKSKDKARKIADAIPLVPFNYTQKKENNTMKTKEFIEKVEALDCCVQEFVNAIHIRENPASSLVVHISKTNELTFGIKYEEHESLDVNTRGKLLDLIVEYTKTPIEEREELKKYHLRLKIAEYFKEPHVFFLNRYRGRFILSNAKQTENFQTVFTQEEIDEMPFELVELFDKIEE